MAQTFEAIIDQDGNIHLVEPVQLPASRRALITILEEESTSVVSETALLSEQALAEDWTRTEEDKAWSHLSSVQ